MGAESSNAGLSCLADVVPKTYDEALAGPLCQDKKE